MVDLHCITELCVGCKTTNLRWNTFDAWLKEVLFEVEELKAVLGWLMNLCLMTIVSVVCD